MKISLRNFAKACLITLSAALLSSCGSSGSSDDDDLVAPSGIDELIITLANTAAFTFIADNNQFQNGYETGTLTYVQNSAATESFISESTGSTSLLSWPANLTLTRYTYQRTGSNTARIIFNGTSDATPNSVFQETTATQPAALELQFNDNGAFITSISSELTVINGGSNFFKNYGADITTSASGVVSNNFKPFNDGNPQPSDITDGKFDSKTLVTNNEAGLITSSIIFNADATPSATGTEFNPVTETGTLIWVLVEITDPTTTPAATVTVNYTADYSVSQEYTTDTAVLNVTNISDGTANIYVDNEWTLDFSSTDGGSYSFIDELITDLGTFTLN